jgi:N-acyl-L-homoserine lactone synthetase
MASNIFGNIFKGIEIRSPTVWEATRFAAVADPRIQPNGVSRAACELMLGIFTFSLEYGVSQITAIYEAPLGRICRRCGINYKVLGSAKMDPNPTIFFALTDISKQLELSVRTATGLLLDQDESNARAA